LKFRTDYFPKQREVIESIIKSDYKFFCLNIGRGGGKTTIIEDVVLYYAIKGKKVLVMTKTSEQLRDNNYNPFVERVEKTNLVKSHNKTHKDFYFKSGGYVKFKSAHKPDSLRGANKYNVVIIDEFAFCPNDVWRELLQITKFIGLTEKVVLASTPNGYNHFYTAYTSELVDKEWKSFTYTSTDNPKVNPDKVLADRLKIPEIVARQEYDAEFIENGTSAFTSAVESCILNKQSYNPKLKYCAGLDIALQNDYTVLTIVNELGEMVDYIRFNKVSTDIWLSKVSNKLKEFKVSYLVAENNYEATLIQLLRREVNTNIEEFKTSSANKNKLIEDLIIEVDLKRLKLLRDEILRGELSRFVQKKTTTGYSYSAITGNDDMVMSLAMANKALLRIKQGSIKVY
jgi:phage terminase large subunit-like protein